MILSRTMVGDKVTGNEFKWRRSSTTTIIITLVGQILH